MGNPHDSHAAVGATELDPEHDIDGKRTIIWMIVWTVAIFVSIWGLYLLFKIVVDAERRQKVDLVPTNELNAFRAIEDEILAGRKGGLSIDDAMQRVIAERQQR